MGWFFDTVAMPAAALTVLGLLWLRPANADWLVPFARLFLPSWKFFDEPGPALTLYVRSGAHIGADSAWYAANLRPADRLSAMVGSSTNARWWARHALLDQLCGAMERCAEPRHLRADVAYQLVCAWVRADVASEDDTFQFKVCAGPPDRSTDILVSAVHRT